ncbi:MAG: hypothetical protein GX352_09535 [Clostridiales bacterium]|nr:hypothetical protein [Clostridiales bacterium]
MKKGFKTQVKSVILVILLLVVCSIPLYLLNRNIRMKNNDLLTTYETLEPITIEKFKVSDIEYTEFFYGEDAGRVTVRDDGSEVLIRDLKHDFLKSYSYNVLHSVNDFRKERLFAEIKSYFNPKFWFGKGCNT